MEQSCGLVLRTALAEIPGWSKAIPRSKILLMKAPSISPIKLPNSGRLKERHINHWTELIPTKWQKMIWRTFACKMEYHYITLVSWVLICRVFPPKRTSVIWADLGQKHPKARKDVLTFPAVRCGHLRHLKLIFHDISDLWKPTIAVIVWEYRTHNKYKDVQRCTKYTQFQFIPHIHISCWIRPWALGHSAPRAHPFFWSPAVICKDPRCAGL